MRHRGWISVQCWHASSRSPPSCPQREIIGMKLLTSRSVWSAGSLLPLFHRTSVTQERVYSRLIERCLYGAVFQPPSTSAFEIPSIPFLNIFVSSFVRSCPRDDTVCPLDGTCQIGNPPSLIRNSKIRVYNECARKKTAHIYDYIEQNSARLGWCSDPCVTIRHRQKTAPETKYDQS